MDRVQVSRDLGAVYDDLTGDTSAFYQYLSTVVDLYVSQASLYEEDGAFELGPLVSTHASRQDRLMISAKAAPTRENVSNSIHEGSAANTVDEAFGLAPAQDVGTHTV